MSRTLMLAAASLCLLGGADQPAIWAAEVRVLADGESIGDTRLQPPKDLDGYFPLKEIPSLGEWEQRAKHVRVAMQVALGLWPTPTKTPVNAVAHGLRDMGNYTIEKVYLESFPGFYVTGNLYRPKGFEGKRPGVLCPHGHFADGRMGDQGRDAVRREIVVGAERFEEGGRNQIQSRCVQLARMGCVVFNYDMIGYCDSQQISFELAHRFARQRPEVNRPDGWGLFSPQAESMLQSVLGLQAWNSVRALDWLSELPEVDPARIAVTGASGGGTQTFILGAIDPRPAVLVPAVMVSTAMQGGCTCENCCLLRVGTGNVEFAALIAPRPLCLISANDWTREMPTKGFPELQRRYQMMGAADKLEHHPLLHFGHNYNYVSREVMYQFLNKYLQLGLPAPVVEEDYPRLTRDDLTVWDQQHPQPPAGPDFERQLLKYWADDAHQQLRQVHPRDAGTLQQYRDIVAPALDVVLGRRVPDADRIEFDQREKTERDRFWFISGLLKHRPADQDPGLPEQLEVLPIVFLVPQGWEEGRVAIWLSPKGKDGLFDGFPPRREVRQLLDAGVAVIGVDLMEQGELLSGSLPLTETRRVGNEREAAAYTFGYNPALFAQRVQDVLTVVGFVAEHPRLPSQIWLIGLDGAGPWAAAARAQAGLRVDRAAIDTDGFRFLNVMDIRAPEFLPGGSKYDDLPGMLAVTAPQRLWLAGEDETSATLVRDAYTAAGIQDRLTLAGDVADVNQAAVAWLLQTEGE